MKIIEEELLSAQEISELYPKFSVNYLTQLRRRRQGPAYLKPSSGMILYPRSTFEQWLEKSLHTNTNNASVAPEASTK